MPKTEDKNPLSDLVQKAGGQIAVAKACGVSPQAVNKWVANGRLPRTEYTGETRYAQIISDLVGGIDAESLLSSLRPAA